MKFDLITTTKMFIYRTESIINSLEHKAEEIHEHHEKANAVRTVGTSIGTLGACLIFGSLIAAPFTGGASVVAVTGLGSVYSVIGAGTSLATEITEMLFSKSFEKDFKKLIESRSYSVDNLSKAFMKVYEMNNEIVAAGVAEKDAIMVTLCAIKEGYDLQSLKSKCEDVKKMTKNLMEKFDLDFNQSFIASLKTVYNHYSLVSDTAKIVRVVNAARNFGNFTLRNGGKYWMNMRLCAQFLQKNLGLAKSVGMGIVRTGFAAVTAVLVVFDIKSTYDSWKNQHPTEAAIEEAISELKEEKKKYQEFVDFLEM